jgi:probable F420-dependent oxidoreductase
VAAIRFGVSVYNVRPAELVAVGRAAEEAGFDSLWLGEHVVLPCDYETEHPTHHGEHRHEKTHFAKIVDPDTELTDPWVGLSALAAVTERIRLATGIYILPLRHPLLTARAAATLADLSGDRFLLGVGSGWLHEEFAALDIPFSGRGGRHEEAIEVLRAAFTGGPFEHQGQHFSFRKVQVSPRPVAVPLVLGGNTEPALRRAARLADGWFASGNPPFDEARRLRRRLAELCAERGSDVPPCYVRVPTFDPSVVEGYAAAGFDQVIFWAQDICPPGSDDLAAAFLQAAEQLGASCPTG